MMGALSHDRPHHAMWLLWLLLFVGLPLMIAGWETRDRPPGAAPRFNVVTAARLRAPMTPPPPVEPVELYQLGPDQAQTFNANIPFSKLPNPAARPFVFRGNEVDLARATDCLAAAQLYEAGDDAVGEKAVAQVVLNRLRHPAFPKTVCGVVFQGQERTTGCQFTFTCDGALARVPSQGAWDRAREIARAALTGKVFKPVGYATHYHTNWVVPYWSGSLDKITAVGTHLFFRWKGWWGTPPAFRKAMQGGEPAIGRIARLSPAHQGGLLPGSISAALLSSGALNELTERPQQPIDAGSLGKTMAGVRLVAIAPGAKGFIVELASASSPESWPAAGQTFCAGRPECRIMAWRSGNTPAGFPLSTEQLETMAFAYIHNAGTNLQRALWNCTQTPRADRNECMRDRLPRFTTPQTSQTAPTAAPILSGVRRKDRFETVTISPPPGPAAPVTEP